MTDDLDALLKDVPISPPTFSGAQGKPKCRRHRWNTTSFEGRPIVCTWCGAPRDEARSRRGKNAARNGKRIQRERIVALGGRNLAGNNENLDGISEFAAYESKSGRSAFSDRYWRWLTDIPVNANQTRVLIVTDAPGPGHRARSYVVVEYSEWKDLHGEIVE